MDLEWFQCLCSLDSVIIVASEMLTGSELHIVGLVGGSTGAYLSNDLPKDIKNQGPKSHSFSCIKTITPRLDLEPK